MTNNSIDADSHLENTFLLNNLKEYIEKDSSIPKLHDFLNLRKPPCRYLSHPAYQATWEWTLTNLSSLQVNKSLRKHIDNMPVLEINLLLQDPNGEERNELGRAFLVLSFLTQAYIWGSQTESPLKVLPNSLAIPFLQVAEKLDCYPIVNYLSTVILNWRFLYPEYNYSEDEEDPDLPLFTINNNISGTIDEDWFFTISLLVESASPTILNSIKKIYIILNLFHEEKLNRKCIRPYLLIELEKIEKKIATMRISLMRMKEECLPWIFYNRVRPYMGGWKGNSNFSAEGLQYGHENVHLLDGTLFQPRKFVLYGASAAQSPIIQALDELFSIEHYEKATGSPTLSIDAISITKKNSIFPKIENFHYLKEMRHYMCASHRNFLTWMEIEWSLKLKDFILLDPELVEAGGGTDLFTKFNQCIDALASFRQDHFKIVTLYVINQASKDRSDDSVKSLLETEATSTETDSLKGSGGTDLVAFLRGVLLDCAQAKLHTTP